MPRIHVFTSAAGNYLSKVNVLFDSLERHHPDWHRHLVLVEDWPDTELHSMHLDANVYQVRDLEIPDWRCWAFGHTMIELCTAVKPFMLQHLLAREDCDLVLYFDPDIAVYSRLDDIVGSLNEASILLTPHQTNPERNLEGVISQEISSLGDRV